MADEKPQGATGVVGGWIKALITGVVSLATGAAIMYLTPVVNNVIKPAKPVSNFAAQATGLTVNFNNRSTGGVQGWWDFGDGSALEPFDPKVENVKHVYPKPGNYNVKLSLANLLGEESDRTAAVMVEADTGQATGPNIELFNLTLEGTRQTAPAVYRLTSKVKNASYCILCYGDSQPMEIIDPGAAQMRFLSFPQMGKYTVRLAAVNGKQLDEQVRTIQVGANDGASPMAKLLVTYDAIRVERFARSDWVHAGWHGDTKQPSLPFRKERLAEPGCTIVSAELVSKDDKSSTVRDVKYEVAPDKKKVVVTGELVRPTGILVPNGTPPHWVGGLKLVMERRSPPRSINLGEIAMSVDLNSTVRIPMQPLGDGYEIVGKKVTLQLWDGSRKAWEGNKTVTNAPVTINGKTCLVTMLPQNDSVLLTMSQPGPTIQPVGFERNPLMPKKVGP